MCSWWSFADVLLYPCGADPQVLVDRACTDSVSGPSECLVLQTMSVLSDKAKAVARGAANTVLCATGNLSRLAEDVATKKFLTKTGRKAYEQLPGPRGLDYIQRGLTSFCPTPPDGKVGDVPVNPGIEGGQCPGVNYVITTTSYLSYDPPKYRFVDGTPQNVYEDPPFETVKGNYIGPIQSIAPNYGASGTWAIQVIDSSGAKAHVGGQDASVTVNLTNVQVARADGQPDDCGDRPPSIPDSEPPPTDPSPPPTVDPDGDGQGNQYTFAPTVGIVYADVDGSVRVPVTINIPELNINLDFEVNLTDPEEDTEPVGDPFPTDDDGRPDPNLDNEGSGKGEENTEDCDICTKLDEIKEKFDEQFSGVVTVDDCNGTNQGYIYGSTGLTGIHDGIQSVQALLKATYEKIPCEAAETEVVALMPSDMYSEFNMESRLTLYFTTVEDYPKRTNTASKWNIEIPNPIENLDWCTHFDNFIVQKGTHFSRVTWNNSKVKTGLYCASAVEGNRVLDLIEGLTTAVPSRRRISSVNNPKVPLSTSTIRVVRAYRSVIENGEVTSCTMYAPPNGPCQPPESSGG